MGKHTDRWRQRTAFVGFDWAGDHHDVVLVDQHGKIVEDFRFDDTAEGWQLLVKTLRKHPDPAVAIETSGGMTVQRLLEAGLRGSIRSTPRRPSAIENARRPAEPRPTTSTPGAWPMRCGSTGIPGGNSKRTIR